jgi:anti-sigma B factor antagonist
LEGVDVNLQISMRESGNVTIVDLQGRVTIGVDNDVLSRHLRELVAKGIRNLLINLADVVQIDSSGIGTIAGVFVTLDRYGGSLKLLRPRGRVRAVLEVMHLLDRIPSFDDETEALSSFRPQGYSAGA